LKDKIITYYNDSDWLYKYFWYNQSTLGLHFGIDSKKTKTLSQSLENQYKILIKEGKIKSGMKVLDAGCGVGGASIYIAQRTKAEVFGISLVPKQIQDAKQNASKRNVSHLTNFSVMDYTKTTFPDNYFDVIFAIESVCHAYPKESFLTEAKRILKTNGKLIIVDGYRIRKELNQAEKTITKNFCSGWKLKELIEEKAMSNKILNSGLKMLKRLDHTNNLTLSKKRFRFLAFLGQSFLFLPGVSDNVLAIKSVLKGLDIGLFGYFVHIATKK
jgi:cyclopropane fatty-acyl-phospholipid synthase-like methyltransferase